MNIMTMIMMNIMRGKGGGVVVVSSHLLFMSMDMDSIMRGKGE
jgi:hypothetical protein